MVVPFRRAGCGPYPPAVPPTTALTVPDPRRRAELADFAARVVQLDPAATVRLRATGDLITAWVSTPFDVLATRAVPGTLEPAEVVAPATGLLTALAVERAARVDPGSAEHRGGGPLPPDGGWVTLDEVAVDEWAAVAQAGLDDAARIGLGSEVLDRTVRTVREPSGERVVTVPLRCLFALSGLGWLDGAGETVRIAATRGWLRLDSSRGAVLRRRAPAVRLLG
jgi:hypothetical protein